MKHFTSYIIHIEVKCFIYDAIYIDNTQQAFKKRMDGHFSYIQRLLKNEKNSDSFDAHFVHHLNTTTSRTDLRNYMTFKVVKQLNLIGAMKKFTKPNFNICMQEHLTVLKKLRDKRVTFMKKSLGIYGVCRHKTTFHWFCLSTDDSVFNGWNG